MHVKRQPWQNTMQSESMNTSCTTRCHIPHSPPFPSLPWQAQQKRQKKADQHSLVTHCAALAHCGALRLGGAGNRWHANEETPPPKKNLAQYTHPFNLLDYRNGVDRAVLGMNTIVQHPFFFEGGGGAKVTKNEGEQQLFPPRLFWGGRGHMGGMPTHTHTCT